MSNTIITTIKKITNSTYLDFIGLAIVLAASVTLGYHKTEIDFTFKGTKYFFFLGYVSILNTGFSMIGNR